MDLEKAHIQTAFVHVLLVTQVITAKLDLLRTSVQLTKMDTHVLIKGTSQGSTAFASVIVKGVILGQDVNKVDNQLAQ